MDLEGIGLSEISQTNIIWFHIHVESGKQMNKQNRNRLIDIEQTDGCQMGGVLRGGVRKVKELGSTNR